MDRWYGRVLLVDSPSRSLTMARILGSVEKYDLFVSLSCNPKALGEIVSPREAATPGTSTCARTRCCLLLWKYL